MSDYSIAKADFEKQKAELKSFAEDLDESTELVKFSTDGNLFDFLSGGLWGLLDHKVTGEEMNNFVANLQKCLVKINERERNVIKEFGQVYETFEVLDKGYIQGILIGVKSAEEASKEAKAAQKDIDNTIKALKQTVQKLQEFKNQVNNHVHLKDIDDMWRDLKSLIEYIDTFSLNLKKEYERLDQKIGEFETYKISLLEISHLKDVDEMWGTLDETVNKIAALKNEIDTTTDNLSKETKVFYEYKEKLDQLVHLSDIDELWNGVQTLKSSIAVQREEMDSQIEKIQQAVKELNVFSKSQVHFGDVDNMWDEIGTINAKSQTYENNINEIIDKQQKTDAQVEGVQQVINDLNAFSESQVHFADVDNMWDEIRAINTKSQTYESNMNEITVKQQKMGSLVETLHLSVEAFEQQEHAREIDIEWEYSHLIGEKLEKETERITDNQNELQQFKEQLQVIKSENSMLKNKISMAYIIAGGAIGISVIQLIVSVLGIL